ncbi:hypothetical protein [Ethanoligenens harbinense]|uniref:Uncharacterized protein n=1 Tax=Ethanoligenens harbinense (strain DSM 18485 / JCM 12961 / CGMCC 1.5033 / YUAN-3) TaxID=663278 RepID=E6U5C1_ETHHY|nr:hypothetical protein [Ethanoligenens harbinense]ADU27934.1 hypothetical protein Ethha_2439 [Ethanoligenens harbinense YUAN-3]AYF42451.1 hypothetical protein CN246_12985 [Ethanoligenens harbinense]
MSDKAWESIIQYASPFVPILIAVLTGFMTFQAGKFQSHRKERQEIYRKQLLDVYLPMHRKWESYNLQKVKNIDLINIKAFCETIWPYFDRYYLLIPESIHNLYKQIGKLYSTSVSDKEIIKKYKELIRLINDQYYLTKKRLGYPSMGFFRQMKSWSFLKKFLFWSFIISLAIATAFWEVMSITKVHDIRMTIVMAILYFYVLVCLILIAREF